MKKLSDYRIREENGKFYIETKVKYSITNICSTEEPVMREGYFDVTDSKGNCIIGLPLKSEFKNEFNTLEAAKAQIIKWCEEPKYHYVREFERYTYNLPKVCQWDLADFYKESLSRADIEYMEKRREEKENKDIIFINEALKINPLFYKLIEKYEERVKSGLNPKTIEKSYADLTLENFELTIKNKELEIQLHELKKKQKK